METTQAQQAGSSAAEYIAAKLEYETTPPELHDLLERRPNDVFVVDIRNGAAYAEGHIPGARNIPLENLSLSYAELPRATLIVIYCGDFSCGLSLLAALELAGTGFRVKRLLGGLAGWTLKGYPVDATPPTPAPEY